MAVNIQCQNHGAVAEAFLYNLWVYASGEKKRSGCMPEIVETNSVEASSLRARSLAISLSLQSKHVCGFAHCGVAYMGVVAERRLDARMSGHALHHMDRYTRLQGLRHECVP